MTNSLISTFESAGWTVHSWPQSDQNVTVLHREPFRLSWLATQLVTYIYIINRVPDTYQSVLDDYASLRRFAKQHKQTLLPFGFQCGYALLPLYVGQAFPEPLIRDIQQTFKARWCVMHVPSLLESNSGRLHTLEAKSFWGCIYRKFITSAVDATARTLSTGRKSE
jgi:hypothetical protein